MVHGAIYKFEGVVSVFNYKGGATYRCYNPTSDKNDYKNPLPADTGLFGVLPGITGTYMANEVIKIITETGEILSGKVLLFNILNNTFKIFTVNNVPENHNIKDLNKSSWDDLHSNISTIIKFIHMKLLLISNSTNPGEPYLDYPKNNIKEFLGPDQVKALFIPYAAVTFSFDAYEEKVSERFREIGHDIVSIHRFKDPVSAVNDASAIVVGGGNTWNLLKMIRDNNLIDIVRKRFLTELHILAGVQDQMLPVPQSKPQTICQWLNLIHLKLSI